MTETTDQVVERLAAKFHDAMKYAPTYGPAEFHFKAALREALRIGREQWQPVIEAVRKWDFATQTYRTSSSEKEARIADDTRNMLEREIPKLALATIRNLSTEE